jgi:hypothetical protein
MLVEMAVNLLKVLPKLNKVELKLALDAMRNYDPNSDYNDIRDIALLKREDVTAALRNFYWVRGTAAALRLADWVEAATMKKKKHAT